MSALEGNLVGNEKHRFAVIVSRFNSFITERLLEGCLDGFARHGVAKDRVTVVRVPGAWEIPLAAKHLADTGSYAAILALGTVIRGATDHYDHVSGEASKGLSQLQLSTGVPMVNAVLATDNLEQAIERAGSKVGNKGFDAAVTAIEMANLLDQDLSAQG